jgi:hypothetical protein
MKDLYKEDEMIAENVKDKDSKIAYLQKAIDVMGECNSYNTITNQVNY